MSRILPLFFLFACAGPEAADPAAQARATGGTDPAADCLEPLTPATPDGDPLFRPASEIPDAVVELLPIWSDAEDAYYNCDMDAAGDFVAEAWALLDEFRTQDVHRLDTTMHEYTIRLVDLERGIGASVAYGYCPSR